MKYLIFICSFTLFFHSDIKPQSNKTEIQKNIDSQKEKFEKIAKSIWTWAEVGYQEEKSTALLKKLSLMKDLTLDLVWQKFQLHL